MYRNELIRTAAQLCSLGIRVFPLKHRTKVPFHAANWKDIATNNVAALPRLFPANVETNLAITVGPDSGILDLECDSDLAEATFQSLSGDAPRTVAYRSRRGIHRLYRWDAGLASANIGILKIAGGTLECRMGTDEKGFYSAAPPSIHPDTGEAYAWLPGCDPFSCQIQELPPAIRQMFAEKADVRVRREHEIEAAVDPIGDRVPLEGHRHRCLLHMASLFYGDPFRFPRHVVEDLLTGLLTSWGRTPADREIANLLTRVYRKPTFDEEIQSINFAELEEAARQAVEVYDTVEHSPHEELPADVFPFILEAMSRKAHACRMSRNLWLMTTLSCISIALGTSVICRASRNGFDSGLQIYGMGVGESGTGKSRVLEWVLKPFRESASVVSDITSEALILSMVTNKRGTLLKSTEGKQILTMLSRYQEHAAGNSVLLEAWSGDPIIKERLSRGRTQVNNPFLTIAAAIQPTNLNAFSTSDVMEGLMQRFLLYPLDRIPDTADESAQDVMATFTVHWEAAIEKLKGIRPFINEAVAPDSPEEIVRASRAMRVILDPAAGRVWAEFQRERLSRYNMLLFPPDHPFRSDLARHAEYALKLSVLLYFADLLFEPGAWDRETPHLRDEMLIGEDAVRRAITLVKWLWYHKQQLMRGIADQRFEEAGGTSPTAKQVNLTQQVSAHALLRYRTCHEKLGELWSATTFSRVTGLLPDQANQEIDMMELAGCIRRTAGHAGVLYSFNTEEWKD